MVICGIVQSCLTACLVGWIWSIVWGVKMVNKYGCLFFKKDALNAMLMKLGSAPSQHRSVAFHN